MSAAELRNALARCGIKLTVHGDVLRFAPRSAVTPDLINRMKTHKMELLAIVRNEAHAPVIDLSDPTSVWQTALDRLDDDPHFPPDLIEALRTGHACWANTGLAIESPNKSFDS